MGTKNKVHMLQYASQNITSSLVLFLCVLICMASSPLHADKTNNESKEAKKLYRVIAYQAPPYIEFRNDNINGMTIRIIKAAFKQAGLNVKFDVYPYPRSIAVCKSDPECIWIGSFEGLDSNFNDTLHQVSFIKYSIALFYNHEQQPRFKEFDLDTDLSGKKIAIMKGSFNDLRNLEAKGATIITLASFPSIVQMLQTNRIDFAHLVELIGEIEVYKQNAKNIRSIPQTRVSSYGGLLFKDKKLAKKIFHAIKKIHEDEIIKGIMQEEIGDTYNINLDSTLMEEILFNTETIQSN